MKPPVFHREAFFVNRSLRYIEAVSCSLRDEQKNTNK